MAEPELFGIGMSTLANIGVAAGTVLLAYYTYKSVKASEEQVKLARNAIEKPRILEKIHTVLNGIQHEIEQELWAIETSAMVWLIASERNDLYLAPLVFPMSPKKAFNLGFRRQFDGPESRPTEQFSPVIERIDEYLKIRYDTYRSLDQEFIHLAGNIRDDGIDSRVERLLSKSERISLELNAHDPPNYTIFRDNAKIGIIPKTELHVSLRACLSRPCSSPWNKANPGWDASDMGSYDRARPPYCGIDPGSAGSGCGSNQREDFLTPGDPERAR